MYSKKGAMAMGMVGECGFRGGNSLTLRATESASGQAEPAGVL